ncbi:MAG: SH3 domain-containing protein [Deltaproteobacteria bacterium]|nr:SH3 domain-containing protein [Deltaproteobacteria bacterium]
MKKFIIMFHNNSTKEIVCFCFILAICISLSGLGLSVQCSVAAQQTDIQNESVSADLSKQTDSAVYLDKVKADQIKLKKITCLHIIREDYSGLSLSYPSKLFFDSVKKEIYVTDSGHGRILVYTYDFYPLLSMGKSDSIETPAGIAVDPEGYLFVAQSSGSKQKRARISVLNPSLRRDKDFFFEGFENADSFRPTNIAINTAGKLYVSGGSFRGVVVLNKDGTFSHLLSPVDNLGKGEEQKATICDVEIDSSGRIYLLSEDMGRIYVYDDKENFLFKFGQKGGGSGKLSRPRGMTIDKHNKMIYVIDYMRHTANAYSEDGCFLFEFGGKGWGRGWFQYPSDIVADDSGNVLIADTFNQRVQVLKLELIPFVEVAEKVEPKDIITKELVKEVKPEAPAGKKLAERVAAQYYILIANMNLREKSATSSRIIRLMKKGEEFEILGQDKHDELTLWYLIKTGSGRTGWLCGIYRGKVMFEKKK